VSVAGEALRGPAGASGEHDLSGARSGGWPRGLAIACTLVMLAATAEIVLDGALGHSPLIPKSPTLAGWLQGAGERLGFRVFLIALLAFSGAYAVMLILRARSDRARLHARWAIALVGLLQLLVFLGPILLSTDVFSYIAYARMGVNHGVNPYLHGPLSIAGDPIYRYVGSDWRHTATAYGPIYTLFSYPLAWLGLTGALWALKLEALLASVGALWLVWRCARVRGLDPIFALLLVGANPLWVIYALGGAHNDLIMMLLMMVAVSLTVSGRPSSGREAWAGAALAVGALVKATVAVLLPFMIVGRRRTAPLLGVLGAIALGALPALGAFGVHGLNIVAALNRDAALVSTDSFATEIAHLLGKPGVFPVDHDLLKLALVLIVAHLLWRTWRGYDWVAASGWALIALAITSTWLLAWYTLWPLPLAAVCRDRRLLAGVLSVQALFVIHQISPLLSPVA
jgi:alpha-1,6-mannosyltransferase